VTALCANKKGEHMESSGPWKLIKAGFWIGIGFIVPSIGVYILGTYLIYSMPSFWQSAAMEDGKETMEQFMSNSDKTNQIKITQFREVKNGKQLLILGTVENTGESSVGSIRVEAELLDGDKQMVFECSEYMSKKLKQGETENFQIKCGCGDQPAPDHKSITVRVVQANSY
jgi:hypothetical protein